MIQLAVTMPWLFPGSGSSFLVFLLKRVRFFTSSRSRRRVVVRFRYGKRGSRAVCHRAAKKRRRRILLVARLHASLLFRARRETEQPKVWYGSYHTPYINVVWYFLCLLYFYRGSSYIPMVLPYTILLPFYIILEWGRTSPHAYIQDFAESLTSPQMHYSRVW